MTSPSPRTDSTPPVPTRDGVDLLDACHRETLATLHKLAALVRHLNEHGTDPEAQALAGEIVVFFSNTARQHHEDEERHVFPRLLMSPDPEIVKAIERLQQDHGWLQEDWRELGPQIDALAGGQSWVDLDILREGVDIFLALSHEHMELEESLIYPALRAQLLTRDRREMGREMVARRRAMHKSTAKAARP